MSEKRDELILVSNYDEASCEHRSDANTATSIERDRINYQLTTEIFERLLKFGNESDRELFCQRLQAIWQEQGIYCQTHPMITNQILDLYKLHHLVQERQGYLEITTNRGWKEISNVLGFGDSGSAAYSVKRNYVRLGLLAYECRFDRAGIDPRSVIELAEMPHTVKKRKRRNNSATVTVRTVTKTNQSQYHMQLNQPDCDNKKAAICISSIDNQNQHKNSTSSYRLTPEQMPIKNFEHISYILRAGCLADSNKHLDTLLVWLSDPNTAVCFNLKTIPGLFNAIMEQYLACLYELFGESFLQYSPKNDAYMNWIVQTNLRIDDNATGPHSNEQYLESLFFGTRRYIIRRLLTKIPNQLTQQVFEHTENNHSYTDSNNNTHNERCHSIMIRCSCLSTIIRNLTFVDDNEHLANDCRLLDTIERMLNCRHQYLHQIFDYEISKTQQYLPTTCADEIPSMKPTNNDDDQSNVFVEQFTKLSQDAAYDDPLSCRDECYQQHLVCLLDNTFITLSNLSAFIELRHCYTTTRCRLINTLVHWILCSLSLANEPFISMIIEDECPNNKQKFYISPRQISLQILAKLCTNEINVDFILLDLHVVKVRLLCHAILSIMNTLNHEDINREYCLLIICSLCKRNRQLVEFFCSHLICLELIFNYLELYEYNQQQYLLATLTSCYNGISALVNTPVNHSIDMMIDSCVQLLLLFAPIKENNYLKLFEHKLLTMSSSIYFEQRILKAFADILYTLML